MAVPLLIIPLAIYNMIAFLTPPDGGWGSKVITVRLLSGVDWTITFGDVLIALALVLLCVELVKAARPGARAIIDHFLSFVVLAAAVAELVMVREALVVKGAASSIFAILCAICLIDFIGGIGVSVRTSRRPGAVELAAPRHVAPPRIEPRDVEPPRGEPPGAEPAHRVAGHVPDVHPPSPQRADSLEPEPPRPSH